MFLHLSPRPPSTHTRRWTKKKKRRKRNHLLRLHHRLHSRLDHPPRRRRNKRSKSCFNVASARNSAKVVPPAPNIVSSNTAFLKKPWNITSALNRSKSLTSPCRVTRRSSAGKGEGMGVGREEEAPLVLLATVEEASEKGPEIGAEMTAAGPPKMSVASLRKRHVENHVDAEVRRQHPHPPRRHNVDVRRRSKNNAIVGGV